MYDRILKIIRHYNLSISEFSREIGLNSAATIQKIITYKRKASPKTTGKILNRFPEVQYDWLITGQGEMLKEETKSKSVIDVDEMTVTTSQVTKYLKDNYPQSWTSIAKSLESIVKYNHENIRQYLNDGKEEIRDEIKNGFSVLKIDTEKIRVKSKENTKVFSTLHNNTLNKVVELESQIHILNKKIAKLDILIETIEKHNLIEKEKISNFIKNTK